MRGLEGRGELHERPDEGGELDFEPNRRGDESEPDRAEGLE